MNENKMASLQGTINLNGPFARNAPKQVQLLDAEFNVLYDEWTKKNYYKIENLAQGLYSVKISLTSGEQLQKTIEIDNDELNALNFDEPLNAGLQSRDFTKVATPTKEEPLLLESADFDEPMDMDTASIDTARTYFHYKQVPDVSIILHSFSNGDRNRKRLTHVNYSEFENENFPYSFRTDYRKHILEIESSFLDSKLIICPPNSKLNLELKINPNSFIQTLEATIYSENWDAEALLNLLNNGAMREAKNFVNAQLAEDFLQAKISNPSLAAIGGYFLLKIKDFSRLHDWANNLANWFDWLPDGPIIHAWQMISVGNHSPEKTATIRTRLLEAQRRGIPLYTEGLRLLNEGLLQLSILNNAKDEEVEYALQEIKTFLPDVDWSCKNTTINNHSWDPAIRQQVLR